MFPLSYVFYLFLAGYTARADLPIHALISDIKGKWKIHTTAPLSGQSVTCGSSLPNTVEGNLKLGDYFRYLKKTHDITGHAVYDLTLDVVPYNNTSKLPHRSAWRALAVKNQKGHVVGTWTAIYDQGFEIILNNGARYFFYMRYMKKDGDNYETDPTSTQIGWAYRPHAKDSSEAERACAYAKRLDAVPQKVAAVVRMLSNNAEDKYTTVDRFIRNGSYTLSSMTSKESVSKKEGAYACSCKNKKKVHFKGSLPTEFRWNIPNAPEVVQQKCGTCYAVATKYVLQARFLIQLAKLENPTEDQKIALEELSNYDLDIDNTANCDMFNQGCKGGYPYLTGKRMHEFGLLTTKHPHKHCSLLNQERRYFAKAYGYLGGCYQCTACQGEDLILHEVYNSGPVAVALDASILDVFYDGTVITIGDGKTNAAVCDVHENPILTGWEYTSHAVVIEGWGEELINGRKVKYWICRNSWGKNWGEAGYFKIERGVNAFGIESEPVFVDPDLDRFTQKPGPAVKHTVHKRR